MGTVAKKKSFVTQLDVRFGDVDPAGIAYYPRIFEFIHQATEALWDVHVGRRYFYLLSEEKLGFPLVHSEVEFKHPLNFGDRPLVKVTVFKVGTSSLGLHYQFTVDDVECVDARMTVVCTRLDGLESVPIPAKYREKFEELLEE
jgi:YbgC/YbaW family acyl-CoA thioester hydrolase